MPPQNDRSREWESTLHERLPNYTIVLPETDEDALHEIVDADAAYGVVPPEALAVAKQLRWIQSAQAGPSAGYYYADLIEHQAVITNPRGVFNDHIAQHILTFVLSLARGLPPISTRSAQVSGTRTRARRPTSNSPRRSHSS